MNALLVLRTVVLKLARLAGILFVVATLCFFSLNLLPGGPARAILGVAGSSPEAIRALNAKLGLDRPLLDRFGSWLGGVLHGDFGDSYQSGVSVAHIIAERAPVTLELIIYGQLIALVAAVPIAAIAAARQGTGTDRSISIGVFTILSAPNFVIGFILIWIFAIALGLYPASGYTPWSYGLGPHLSSLVLPSICMATGPFALYQRVLRADLIETYHSQFMAVARAKGITPVRAAVRHALRPSLVGLTTTAGVMIGTLIGGAVIVESLFSLPGLGLELEQAVSNRDYVEVQGIVLVMAAFYVVVNTLVDLLYTVIDPRLRSVQARMVGSLV